MAAKMWEMAIPFRRRDQDFESSNAAGQKSPMDAFCIACTNWAEVARAA
jgi:hypothetical protein